MKPENSNDDRQRFRHIRRVILVRVLLLPFVLVMFVFGTVVYYFGTNLETRVASELARTAGDHRRMIEQFLDERVANLNFVAVSIRMEGLRREGVLNRVLRDLQESSPAFFDLGVFDDKGNHVAYAGPYDLLGKNYADAEWFRAVQDQRVYISDVFLGYRKLPHFVIVVRSGSGSPPWYLRATIDTQIFNDLVEGVRVGKTGEAYLINPSGMFQSYRHSGGALMEVDPDRHLYRSDDSGIVTSVLKDGSGTRYVNATGRLHPTRWLLVVRQTVREAYAPLSRALVIGIAIILGGGALVVLMGFLLASSLARQLVLSDREKRQLGTQLIMAGKFAELGEMSVGIAHEINNPLQIMRAEQTLMTDLLGELGATAGVEGKNSDMVRDSLEQIGIQIDRCKQITQGLLNFSRKADAVSKRIDLVSFIPEVIRMIEEKAKVDNVRIVHESCPDHPEVVGDPSQLQQVLLNLLNNALYALEGKENGEIRITSSRAEDTVTISVADNGCGIDPEIIDKIFLPFFTTKPVGQGTGLGLSTIYGIVERWGGQVRVSSEPDVGSVFTVRLPVPTKTRVFENKVVHETRGGLGHDLR